MDICSAHPDVQLSNVKLVFLPPNTTSRLQPCDAGIIANLKTLYRKRLLRHVLAEMDSADSATALSKQVNVLDAIGWASLAWAGVCDTTIKKYFARCGFRADEVGIGETPDTQSQDADEAAYAPLMGDVRWDEYVAIDSSATTSDVVSDEWEADIVAKARGEVAAESDDSEEEEEEEPPAHTLISSREALDQVKNLVHFARLQNDTSMLDAASELQDLVEAHRLRQAATATQKKMDDFFVKH